MEKQSLKETTSPSIDETLTDQESAEFYSRIALEHFLEPKNVGEMSDDEASGYALVGDPVCGDQMKLWIKVKDDIIVDIKFKSFGCPGAISTSSMATTLAKGKTINEALDLSDDDVVRFLGCIPENKKHCSLLGINALHKAIDDYVLRKATGEVE